MSYRYYLADSNAYIDPDEVEGARAAAVARAEADGLDIRASSTLEHVLVLYGFDWEVSHRGIRPVRNSLSSPRAATPGRLA